MKLCYVKPTNSYNYLAYSSCHPSHKPIIKIATDIREKMFSSPDGFCKKCSE